MPEKGVEARLFGRNTYPTMRPEPHGYALFLTWVRMLKQRTISM